MERTRLTAKKTSLSEISTGKFIKKQGFESSYVATKLGRRLSRVRIMGLLVDKFASPDGKYATITLDDGTDTLRCKSFVNIKIFDGFASGDLLDLIGKLREYNEEIYVMPETIKKVESNFEILRLLELQKIILEQRMKIKKMKELESQTQNIEEIKNNLKKEFSQEDAESLIEAKPLIEDFVEKKTAAVNLKANIMNLIEQLDNGTGADYQDILSKTTASETEIDLAIQDLLESGVCFETRPGKIKKL